MLILFYIFETLSFVKYRRYDTIKIKIDFKKKFNRLRLRLLRRLGNRVYNRLINRDDYTSLLISKNSSCQNLSSNGPFLVDRQGS